MDPIATPFDISPIPIFPYEVTIYHWGILCGLVILIAIILQIFLRISGRRRTDPLDIAISEIKNILSSKVANGHSLDLLFRLSLLSKRLLTAVIGRDISVLALSELEELEIQQPVREVKRIISLIREIDGRKYRGVCEETDLDTLARNLLAEIESWKVSRLGETR